MSNLRYLWKLINEVINRNKIKPQLPDHFKENENLIADPTEINNKFNEYFINVAVSDRNFLNYLHEDVFKNIEDPLAGFMIKWSINVLW